jgi:phosphoglycerate kinase
VGKLDPWRGEAGLRAVSHLGEGEIVMLENLAFEPGEATGDDRLADALSRLCDIYCNEAFALAHEVRASTVGVAKRAARALAGIAFERHHSMLEHNLREPRSPCVVVLGGAASKDKLIMLEEIARHCERILVGGELAFPFLVARRVIPRRAPIDEEMVTLAERAITAARLHDRALATPADYVVTDRRTFERLSRGDIFAAPNLQNITENEIAADHVICDIGQATRWSWSDGFPTARTVFWHGPLGISEIEEFCAGSRFLANELASRTWPTLHRAVVCGGSLVAALHRGGITGERLRHMTYAGRAALNYFAGRPLPAVDVLNRASAPPARPACVIIPLNGSERDLSSLTTAADVVARDAQMLLLHVRSGPDEEKYPDLAQGINEADRLERRLESERIFARANAVLAERGLVAARQLAVQGRPTTMILRYARRLNADMIVLVAATGAFANFGARRVIDRAPCAALVARPR